MTEADTCRKFVVPLLQKAGWDNDPHSIAEQRYFTAGRIVAQGQTARRRPEKRADYLQDRVIEQLAERGVDFHTVAAQAGKPDAAPFDLLCHLAFNAPVFTRRQRADRVKKQQAAFFAYYAPEAREILSDLLEKHAADVEFQFTLPDVLKVPPISTHGNVAEIAKLFGGLEQLGTAVNQLQSLPYAA
jgi:type I restriction enzyme R subunit